MNTLRISTLIGLSSEQISEKLESLADIGNSYSAIEAISAVFKKVAEYEKNYGFSSREMMEKVASGELTETKEIMDWGFEFSILLETQFKECQLQAVCS